MMAKTTPCRSHSDCLLKYLKIFSRSGTFIVSSFEIIKLYLCTYSIVFILFIRLSCNLVEKISANTVIVFFLFKYNFRKLNWDVFPNTKVPNCGDIVLSYRLIRKAVRPWAWPWIFLSAYTFRECYVDTKLRDEELLKSYLNNIR